HAANEIIDRRKHLFLPDPVDKRDIDGLPVEVAGKIEQENFEQHRAAVEHRPSPEARDPVMPPAADPDAHRIDAVAQSAARVEFEIRGRETEFAAALVAMNHLARDEPGEAEEF